MDILDSEKLIVELNYRNEIVDERERTDSFRWQKMLDLLPETVVDKRTLQMLEIQDLFKALDHTFTSVGSARLFHSLVNPTQSIEHIHSKQDSFCEIESNDRLKNSLIEYLNVFKEGEDAVFKFLNAHMQPLFPYRDFSRAMAAIKTMLQAARAIPQPETVYLDSLIKSILSFSGSPANSIVSGPKYRTFGGIKAREEKSFFTPSLRFRPGRLSGGSIMPFLPGLYFGAAWFTGLMEPAMAESLFLATSWMSIIGLLYGGLIKPMFDFESAVLPIRRRLLESNRFVSAIEAVAAIDELLSFVAYSQAVPHPTYLPEVTNGGVHYFFAENLRNPIMAKYDKNFVANDVDLDAPRLSFITGPNSGGKTTYCKTIAQSQILGQIGAPIVASKAKMNMTDKLTYQAPAFDTLNDPEGRFGTELKDTRDIFYSVTPKSLAILDEIAEGTTAHEKMNFSVDIMNGLHAIGCNTLLVTHSAELVERFQEMEKGQYLQVEFDGDKPTHRLIEGISQESHAYRVARKIGFASEDIERYLKEKGYIA